MQNAWFRGGKSSPTKQANGGGILRRSKEETQICVFSFFDANHCCSARVGNGQLLQCDEPPRSGARPAPRATAAAETALDLAPRRRRSGRSIQRCCRAAGVARRGGADSGPPREEWRCRRRDLCDKEAGA